MTIIGATHRIKHLVHEASKKRTRKRTTTYSMRAYRDRNESLRFYGYATYQEYLQSDEWKAIRSTMLEKYPRCVVCQVAAEVVHHIDYDEETLLGLRRSSLACLCHACHEKIEIDEQGEKRSLKQANKKLFELVKATGRTRWLNGRLSQRKNENTRMFGPKKKRKHNRNRRRPR